MGYRELAVKIKNGYSSLRIPVFVWIETMRSYKHLVVFTHTSLMLYNSFLS